MRILLCQGVESPEVNTKPQGAILFPDQHHSITPGAVAWSDCSHIYHQVEVLSHLINLWRQNPPKPFLKQSSVGIFELNDMFCSLCTSDLVLLQREQDMVLCEEASCLLGCLSIPRLQSRQIQLLKECSLPLLLGHSSRIRSLDWTRAQICWGNHVGSDHSGNGHSLLDFHPFISVISQHNSDSIASHSEGSIGAKNLDSQRELRRLLLQAMCHHIQLISH